MKCSKCHFDNRNGIKFCEECGASLGLQCPNCGALLPVQHKFCGECGRELPAADEAECLAPVPVGQRKQITVLFCDLVGYTSMTEKMDPEEVKEIMDNIFGKVAQVITKYEGFIEKFVGDAVMAIFGAPKAHEDDAVRAILAAREIHSFVPGAGARVQERLGQPLAMHSGIDSGLVVTGDMDLSRGTHGLTGDPINRASRLCSLARAGEILVGEESYREARGFFEFEACEPARVKGKSEPVRFYKIRSPRIQPSKPQRVHGLHSELIGRSVELAHLMEAFSDLREKKGSIISVCGDAGTGKSRLIEEFKSSLDLENIRWLEAHAYAYTQNIPYWPLIDLLNRTWLIEEGDSREQVRKKIEAGVELMLGKCDWVCSTIMSLYSANLPEVEEMEPEMWKSRFFEAIHVLLAARTHHTPTVLLIEDLHWADASSSELLRFLITEFRYPALFLCVYRPHFSFFTANQLTAMGKSYREIRLEDLSPSEAQGMLESLLKTKNVPFELRHFIQEMTGGNPFYLEEVIHSMIESEILVHGNGGWKFTRPLCDSDICPTVQGVIAARLDRLNTRSKRILQEASVIGRAFLYEILENVTAFKDRLEQCLSGLERSDLIRARSLQPDLEYMFKHALTHEVVYNGLLKKERRTIHERIALVMEKLFRDRLPEFYETIAFHYRAGKSVVKAVDYLVKSGEKSLKRYAVEESHRYFEEAFELLKEEMHPSVEAQSALLDLLIRWASVYYYRGDYRGLLDRLEAHKDLAESLPDKSKLAMFYAWLSCAMWHREKFKEANQYLSVALKLGEEAEDQHVIGYVCTWMSWTTMELGLLDEAVELAERAQQISKGLAVPDQFMHFNSLAGLGYAHWHRGERQKVLESGQALLDYGQSHFNIRSMVMGHTFVGFSHLLTGELDDAVTCFQEAIEVSVDPWYSQFPRLALCYARVMSGRFEGLEEALNEIISFSRERGAEYVGSPAQFFLGVVLLAGGQMNRGMKLMEDIQKRWLESGSKLRYAQGKYITGSIYAQIASGGNSKKLSVVAKNLGFLVTRVPFARQKAVESFNAAVVVAEKTGAKVILGKCYLSLGLLFSTRGKTENARRLLTDAAALFQECEALTFHQEAMKALDNLGQLTT